MDASLHEMDGNDSSADDDRETLLDRTEGSLKGETLSPLNPADEAIESYEDAANTHYVSVKEEAMTEASWPRTGTVDGDIETGSEEANQSSSSAFTYILSARGQQAEQAQRIVDRRRALLADEEHIKEKLADTEERLANAEVKLVSAEEKLARAEDMLVENRELRMKLSDVEKKLAQAETKLGEGVDTMERLVSAEKKLAEQKNLAEKLVWAEEKLAKADEKVVEHAAATRTLTKKLTEMQVRLVASEASLKSVTQKHDGWARWWSRVKEERDVEQSAEQATEQVADQTAVRVKDDAAERQRQADALGDAHIAADAVRLLPANHRPSDEGNGLINDEVEPDLSVGNVTRETPSTSLFGTDTKRKRQSTAHVEEKRRKVSVSPDFIELPDFDAGLYSY